MLLLFFLLQIAVGGFFLLWQKGHQYHIRHTQLRGKVEYLVLDANVFETLYWEEEGKEFVFEGKRYDVFSIQKEKNSYKIACFHDKKEEKIIKNITSQFSDNQPNKTNYSKIKFPFWEFYWEDILNTKPIFLTKKQPVFLENEKAVFAYYCPISPPPNR